MKKILSVLSLVAAFSAFANEPLELTVNVYLNNELVVADVVQAESGQLQSITAKDVLMFNVTPTLNDDVVTLTSSMHKYKDGSFSKFAEPVLRVALDKQAVIEIGTEGKNIYKVEVTTKKI
ncbi:hypothetical protein WG68_07025 [Arsukibacterium ikkense]|uniref:Uncharacterized protein n=1 Tax=Arsukibacterium ikkense TaxID=336831 RepID=A0A0M2VAE9_9GAMM|nr:hypothetical protein [Arsukibacterium ikkense]KKO46103.1 hypothetical protein WG68_07025 [Arsukibacterium ikkense]